MAQQALWRFAVLTLCFIGTVSIVDAAADVKETDAQLLPGNRILRGTVEEVRSDQAKVNTGEGQPRYIPMNVRKDRPLIQPRLAKLSKGDAVVLLVDNENKLNDVSFVPGKAK